MLMLSYKLGRTIIIVAYTYTETLRCCVQPPVLVYPYRRYSQMDNMIIYMG